MKTIMQSQRTFAALFMGMSLFATPALAQTGKCNLSTVVGSLLKLEGNQLVKDLYDDLGKISEEKLKKLREQPNFYPATGSPDRPRLITRFEDAIKGQGGAFNDFLQDLVGARDPACENCRYVDQWALVKEAGYPNVTPEQLRSVSLINYRAINDATKSKRNCSQYYPAGPEREGCEQPYVDNINNWLGTLRTDYPVGGYAGGAEFAARMGFVDRKANCYKKTNEPFGP
jgi:hypothetical protein